METLTMKIMVMMLGGIGSLNIRSSSIENFVGEIASLTCSLILMKPIN